MSAMVLQFRRPRSRCNVTGADLDWARDVLRGWLRAAGLYGWFLIEAPPAGRRSARRITARKDESAFTIGHRAVDNDGIYQLTPEFDGWALLSRRGELSVFDTLPEALASICPTPIAA